ncbi:hypothetical protein [Borrelia turcica]|nr:hypothetical protein [Borrelia turcica]
METNKKETELLLEQIINKKLLPIMDIIAKLQKEVNTIPDIDEHVKTLNRTLLKHRTSLAKQDEKLSDFDIKMADMEEYIMGMEERVRKRINRGIDKIIAVYSSKYANEESDKKPSLKIN